MIFLRPYWLILLIVPFLFFWIRRKGSTENPWQAYIAKNLMPYLRVSAKVGGGRQNLSWLLCGIWTIMVIALSGPAVDKLPAPAVDIMPATVLVVDLNTLNPEKATLLHIKLYNLINELKDNRIGLVLYDTKGYVALPLTRDKEILSNMIPALEPTVMPSIGNDSAQGFQKAIELLQNTDQHSGRILLITGGTPDIERALPLIQNTPYRIGVLGIRSEETGTPIIGKSGTFLRDKEGNIILSKPDAAVLSQLGTYYATTPTGEEIKALIQKTEPSVPKVTNKPVSDLSATFMRADIWRDLGAYLTLLLLPLVAWLFRKGIFFGIVLFIFGGAHEASAGLWLRPDQESYRAVQAGNAAYRAQDYEKALKFYENQSGTEALYNRANALAQTGAYQAAIEAYGQILEQMPTHQDAAYNKEYLEKQLQNQQQNNQQNQSSDEQKSDSDLNSDSNQQPEKDSADSSESGKQDNNPNNSPDSEKNSNQGDENADSAYSTESPNQSNEEQTDDSADQQTAPPAESDNSETQEQQSPNTPDQQSTDFSQHEDSSKNIPQNTVASDSEDGKGIEQDQVPSGFENNLSSDIIDQETQQIINRLKKDPSRLLRYRLYRQYRENP